MYSFSSLNELVCAVSPLTKDDFYSETSLYLHNTFIFAGFELLEVYCPYNLEYTGKIVSVEGIPYMFNLTNIKILSGGPPKNPKNCAYHMFKLTPI